MKTSLVETYGEVWLDGWGCAVNWLAYLLQLKPGYRGHEPSTWCTVDTDDPDHTCMGCRMRLRDPKI